MNTPALDLHVTGIPAPQGSKRGFYNAKTNRVQMVESSKKVGTWRQDVIVTARKQLDNGDTAWPVATELPVRVVVTFYLRRPKNHYGTGRNATTIKHNAPTWPATSPDLDKLIRATLDALTVADVFADDRQVHELVAKKRYADVREQGAHIRIEAAT